jgi:membrane protein implicated in regulation of membrane protease activity
MEPWAIWALAAVVLLIGEAIVSFGLLGSVGVACLAAAIAAAAGADLNIQLAIFAVVGIVALLAARKLIPKQGEPRREQRTNVDALPGSAALVTTSVDRHGGEVKLAGETWSARSEEEEFPVGAQVTVVRIEGATAIVSSTVEDTENTDPSEEQRAI